MRTDTHLGLTATQFPVSVILQRRPFQHGPWSLPRWELVGVVAGEAIAGEGGISRRVIRSDEHSEQYLWTGFKVELHKDSAESYWYNLVGKTPSLFVICRSDPENESELLPYAVSANHDEAGAHMEADDTVFSAPMPPEVYQWLERYVVANYVPQEPHKRKRKRWADKAGDGEAS